MFDRETGLEIGDPDALPFEKYRGKRVDKELQENVEKRLRFGTASVSGIRQIFDTTHGDEETDYVDGTGVEITDAAKVHVATIADGFVRLLKEQVRQSSLTVLVAIDSRHTGPAIADVMIRILAFHGVDVRYTFITPITEAAVYSKKTVDGFIYISSSHNPRGYNGLKMGLNDGRLLPGKLADPFIDDYKTRVKDPENTEAVIRKVNSASPDAVREIYEAISGYGAESREIYAKLSDQIITGLKIPEEIAERKKSLKKEIRNRDIWIGLDFNGGARQDREYLQSWGFHVLEINGRPQIDMVHELSPTRSACQQAVKAMIRAQSEDKNIAAFLVFDTDGDRKNIVLPDGKDGAEIPGVQMVFALDVLCCVLDSGCHDREVGIAINGPTSSVVEKLARHLNFTIKRVEVGEANVASAGMSLHEQGLYVPIMGEGSNGSVFNLDLLVREPLHTVRTLVNFVTRPELTKTLLKQLDQEDKYDNWHSPEQISGLFANIIESLPPSRTTDFFTAEGIRRGNPDVSQELFKANFDKYFETRLWRKIAEEIRENFQGEPIAEFVNYEGESELRGKGNRKNNSGGYKVEFYVQTRSGEKWHIGWIWFRPSGTERGVMRRGTSITHWEMTPEAAEVVEKTYTYIDSVLTDALDDVEAMTDG